MYVEHRQHPKDGPTQTEMDSSLQKIVDYFGQAWLEDAAGSHELQLLWQRKDATATVELITFGYALHAADSVDKKWVAQQIKQINGTDRNNRRGAFFELLSVGSLVPRHEITPAPANQPGYDVSVKIASDYRLLLSLKCYSESTHEHYFQRKAREAKEKFVDSANGRGIAVQVFVQVSVYPGESEWEKLFDVLSSLGRSFDGQPITVDVNRAWKVAISPLQLSSGKSLSGDHVSHTFICVAPHHKNEQANFLSKLGDAISNAEKHISGQDDSFPCIHIRVPPTVSCNTLQKWTQDYLNGLTNPKVLTVTFIQPYLVVDSKKEVTYVAYHIAAATCVSLLLKTKSKGARGITVPFGVVTSQPPLWQLVSEGAHAPLIDQYIYQQGQHFVLANTNGTEWSCNLTRSAPGVEEIGVFNINGQQLIFGGRWGNDLLLIGG
jgi:hypothetical protein